MSRIREFTEQEMPFCFRFGRGYSSYLGAHLPLRLDSRTIIGQELAFVSFFIQILSQCPRFL